MEAILTNIITRADTIKQQIKTKLFTAKKEKTDDNTNIINEIKQVEKELENARSKFDMQTDFDLIDISILEMNAIEKRYSYLLREAKEQGIVNNY